MNERIRLTIYKNTEKLQKIGQKKYLLSILFWKIILELMKLKI